MIKAIDIAKSLGADRSKANVKRIVLEMAKHGYDFEEYLQVVEQTKLPFKWYLTWNLSHYLQEYSHLGLVKQRLFWEFTKCLEHEGMLRDVWRSWSFLVVHEELEGDVFDKAVRIIPSQMHAVAVRAHAMKAAYNIAKNYREIAEELILVLEDLDHDESSGIRVRAKNILKDLRKVVNSD
jgi:hypothetical protein